MVFDQCRQSDTSYCLHGRIFWRRLAPEKTRRWYTIFIAKGPFLQIFGWELRNIYHHHHPESKIRKSSEAISGSMHPYGRYGIAVKMLAKLAIPAAIYRSARAGKGPRAPRSAFWVLLGPWLGVPQRVFFECFLAFFRPKNHSKNTLLGHSEPGAQKHSKSTPCHWGTFRPGPLGTPVNGGMLGLPWLGLILWFSQSPWLLWLPRGIGIFRELACLTPRLLTPW